MAETNSYTVGAADTRPWGTWHVIDVGEDFAVKRICVNPGGKLSLQRHKYRSEHWTVVQGRARVQIDDVIKDLYVDQSVYIPVHVKHRIECVGTMDLIFIEVQCGETLDENDIERFEDTYGRVPDAAGGEGG